MTGLQQFLIEHPIGKITGEAVVSERIFDESGDPVCFKIRAVSGEEHAQYQRLALIPGRGGRPELDPKRYNELVVINHTEDPSFKDVEAIEKAKCRTPEEFLYKSLLAGEISRLAAAIGRLSGFQSFREAREEAKNS